METLAKIIESGLIVKLSPAHNRPVLPYLAALCSGGVCAAEFPIDNPSTIEAIRGGSKLFPDLILGAGGVLSSKDCRKAISAGARYISSPGYSSEIYQLCREQEILYLPKCTTLSELLAVTENGASAVFLFAPHLWGTPELMDEMMDAFPKLTFLASDVPVSAISSVRSHTKISAFSLKGLESVSPEALVSQCHQIIHSIVPSDLY